jgi:hypothetical protein
MNDEDFVRFRLVFLAGADEVLNGEMNFEPGWRVHRLFNMALADMEGS